MSFQRAAKCAMLPRMCGRFVQTANKDELEEAYNVALPDNAILKPRYNLAPGQPAAVITAGKSGPCVEFCVWGLVPSWAKDQKMGYKMINARSESVWEKPSFRNPLRYRRCLVPANGFYEWKATPGEKRKTPYLFTLKDRPLFSFAGLWEVWNDRDGGELYTFTILTRAANTFMKPYHARMPLILQKEQEGDWLNHAHYRPEELDPVLHAGAVELQAVPVSTRVNQVSNDDPECIRPAPEQRELL